MNQLIILEGATLAHLFTEIDLIVEKRIAAFIKHTEPPQSSKYFTREEVSNLLKISLRTLSNWTNQGLVNSYKIGKKVLYKSNEIDASLNKRKFQRFKL